MAKAKDKRAANTAGPGYMAMIGGGIALRQMSGMSDRIAARADALRTRSGRASNFAAQQHLLARQSKPSRLWSVLAPKSAARYRDQAEAFAARGANLNVIAARTANLAGRSGEMGARLASRQVSSIARSTGLPRGIAQGLGLIARNPRAAGLALIGAGIAGMAASFGRQQPVGGGADVSPQMLMLRADQMPVAASAYRNDEAQAKAAMARRTAVPAVAGGIKRDAATPEASDGRTAGYSRLRRTRNGLVVAEQVAGYSTPKR